MGNSFQSSTCADIFVLRSLWIATHHAQGAILRKPDGCSTALCPAVRSP